MANLLRSTPLALIAAIFILVQATVTYGWMPRLLTACSGVRFSGSGAVGRQRVLLSASDNANDGSGKLDDESDDLDSEILPLFVEGGQLNAYVSRLEAIFDIGSDFYSDDKTDSTESQRLLEEGDRVVLGDWMEWEEGICQGDSCGDDFDQCEIPESYKVSSPKVDVMSFLGIRRAQPLQVQRDWD